MRVAALTAGAQDPSARFRVRQFIAPLRAAGIGVEEYSPVLSKHSEPPLPGRAARRAWFGVKALSWVPAVVRSRRSQVVWLQRELVSGGFSLEGLLKSPLVFDVDDAIWLDTGRSPDQMRRIADRAAVVMAGNGYLADWFRPHARRVEIIPTAVDCDRYTPADPAARAGGERFVVGWTGTHWNLKYLESLEAPLARFLQRHADAELLVVANREPSLPRLPAARVRFLPWTSDTEVSGVRGMDAGLMPLPDNEWTRGKCSFKMLQYMACGIPVVVAPVGMNAEVLAQAPVGLGARAEEEWDEALEVLYADRGRARAWGEAGRRLALDRYSRAVVGERIRQILWQVAETA